MTGGSRGIGKATARCLATQGHHICIGYRNREDKAYEVVNMIRALGRSAIAVQVDIADEEQLLSDESSYVTGNFIDLAGGK
nr:SDR family NAD(P)-dependent oxidoreductase [Xenorhabdus japonica]